MYFIHLEKEESELTLNDWKTLLLGDKDMEYTNTCVYISPSGEKITQSGKHFGKYTYDKDKLPLYFWFENGVVSSIYDKLSLNKMHEMSKVISGFVYGDLGEEI